MYFHSGSLDSVRAPQMRMPRPGNARMQLMPTLFRPPCSACVTWKPRPLAPRTTSFAGALCTPRVESVRHHRPATWPDGGTMIGWVGSGGLDPIHGGERAGDIR